MNVKLNAKKYFVAAVVVLLLVFFHYFNLLNPLESAVSRLLTPSFKTLHSLGLNISRIFTGQTASQGLEAELNLVKEKNRQLTVENAKLKFLQEENSVLRKQLNFLDQAERRYLLANIISRGLPGETPEDSQSMVIDRGALDGLIPGLAVVGSISQGASSQGVIIGKVVNVKDHLAEIYLITNKNCKLAASILGENRTAGIVHGELGLTVKMEFIPQTENIKAGDIVATSGLEQNIPRGLIIGRISQTSKENNEVWQTAIIEPLLNLDSLSIVALLLP